MSSTSTQKTLENLRGAFATYGLPEVLVSYNGPQFTSAEFAHFLRTNGAKHVRIPPYHAVSNGAAEGTVQTVKKALLKQVFENEASGKQPMVQKSIDSFLMAHRNTPSSATGKSPAELFFKRQPHVKFSLLKPNFARSMQDKQDKLKEQRDLFRGRERMFVVGGSVLVKTVLGESVSWEEGVVTQIVSAVTYMAKLRYVHRFTHADHLRPRHAAPGEPPPPFEVPAKQTPTSKVTQNSTATQLQQPTDQDAPCSPETPAEPNTNDAPEHNESPPSAHAPQPVRNNLAESPAPATASQSPEPPLLRRSVRVRKQPDCFRLANFK